MNSITGAFQFLVLYEGEVLPDDYPSRSAPPTEKSTLIEIAIDKVLDTVL